MNELQVAVEVFDKRRAALNPVTGVVVENALDVAHLCVMDVSADDTIDALATRFGGERVLEIADEVDGTFDLRLQVFRE